MRTETIKNVDSKVHFINNPQDQLLQLDGFKLQFELHALLYN